MTCDNGKIWNNADPTSGQWVPCDCANDHFGPWFVKTDPVLCVVCREENPVICEITSHSDREDCCDLERIARLIAAAPELLDALVKLVRRTPFTPHGNGITLNLTFEQMAEHKALIAKATGI